MENKIKDLIESYQNKQNSKKKKINIEEFECHIVKKFDSYSKYNFDGGYAKFNKVITDMQTLEILKPINTIKETNNKKPSLPKFWWVYPKYSQNTWADESIAKLSSVLDINFYIKNKKYQTTEELEKVEAIYNFLVKKHNCNVINREERSLQIFGHMHNFECEEPEKILSSKEGITLLNRLKLSNEDLKFEILKESFIYWKNSDIKNQTQVNILIVEGLATYHTIKKILNLNYSWKFDTIPHILIWGAGRRIEGTIQYLFDIVDNSQEVNIQYCGDIDWEGFAIFYNLKIKNQSIKITLATKFYDFLMSYGDKFIKKIGTQQKKRSNVIKLIENEFSKNSSTFIKIKDLWDRKMRIAQEVINIDILEESGWIYKDE